MSRYFLAVDYGNYEGWALAQYETLDEVKEDVYSGMTHGRPFKILKEIEIELQDEEKDNEQNRRTGVSGDS